ncbi:unnamed protein product [Meloidogyne enterolobii]|uniref:Uncharacterized protein n=1 Tax=Meloidogyne enterolobii TaxID=390850 RepID=A0ACB1A3N1_MELEN
MDEYSEFEELGDNAARDNKKTRINPQHLQLEEEEEEEVRIIIIYFIKKSKCFKFKYFVESILERKIENGREEFLVKWEGYSDESSKNFLIYNITGPCPFYASEVSSTFQTFCIKKKLMGRLIWIRAKNF